MKPGRPIRRGDAGYALLMVVFLAALVMLAAAVATPSILTEGRREKEDELLWRGGQYARAVRLFYRKNGRFPQSLEDLTKAQNDIHFLRKPYKDPMNSEDGGWRLIYVGPGGQLIGSVKRKSLLQPPAAGAAPGLPGQPGPLGQGFAPPDAGQPGAGPTGLGAPANPPPGAGATLPAAQPGAPAGTDIGTGGPIIGGNIIGVGSKVKRHSIKVYDGGTTYAEWEFIWDPTKEPQAASQPGTPAGTPPTPSPQLMPRRPQQPPPQ